MRSPVPLTALRGTVLTTERAVALDRFVAGPFRTVLRPGEEVRAVRIPRPGPGARWGYCKLCRKPGEFAHAMAACLLEGGKARVVIGALGGPPAVLAGPEGAEAALGFLGPVDRHLQLTAMRRARAMPGA